MKQTEVGWRYRVHVYYTLLMFGSQDLFRTFSVMYKRAKDRMAQNVKDEQIDRILELSKEQGIPMRYLCELVGKKPQGTGGIFTIKVWNIVYNKTLCKKGKQSRTGRTRRAGFFGGAILPWNFSG